MRFSQILVGKPMSAIGRAWRSLAPPWLAAAFDRLLVPAPVYHLLMLAAFVAVFALIPLTLYLHSGEDWRFRSTFLVELASIGLALWLGAAVLVRLLAAFVPGHSAAAATGLSKSTVAPARPRLDVHYTPTCASWLNQVERFFALLTTRPIRRGSFVSAKDLVAKIDAFVQTYNAKARPFAWTATSQAILAKIARLCKTTNGTRY